MIVVRRMDANRRPHQKMPAKNRIPPIARPTLTSAGLMPPISSWSVNCGSGSLTSWNSVALVNSPRVALMAIQVGASSQTCEPTRIFP